MAAKRLVMLVAVAAAASTVSLTMGVEAAWACSNTVSTNWTVTPNQVWGHGEADCGSFTVCLQRYINGGWGARYNCVTGAGSYVDSLKGNWSCFVTYRGTLNQLGTWYNAPGVYFNCGSPALPLPNGPATRVINVL
jgi:hypothetical protein